MTPVMVLRTVPSVPIWVTVNGRNRVLQSLPVVGECGDRRSESREAPMSQWSLEMVDGLPARLLSG